MNNYDDLITGTSAEYNGRTRLSKEDYAAKKRSEREAVFALSDRTAMDVAKDGGRLRQYLDVQGRVDRYSAVNALLVMAQRADATRLETFEGWKRLGAFVKPGQVAISVLEPYEYTKGDGTPGVGYNVKKVFDINQVDARRVNVTSPLNYSERQLLKALVFNAPVRIIGVDDLPDGLGAMTDPDTGEISVRRGMEFTDIFRSIARELAFASLTACPSTQADPHFSAYCASYLLCRKHGVDTKDFSFAEAPGLLNGMDAREVKGELSQIRDVAEEISGRMAKQLDAANRAAQLREAR